MTAKCGTCNKALTEQTVATKTRKQGEHTIVLASKQALVCPEHGVVCWDPPRATIIQQPAIIPAPYTPQPYRPSNPFPWTYTPNTATPQITTPRITWTNNPSGGTVQ